MSYTKELSEKFEGKLLANIEFFNIFGDSFLITRRFYTVKDGLVYIIEKDQSLYATGDSLIDTNVECKIVGKYNPKTKYKVKQLKLKYSELIKMLK